MFFNPIKSIITPVRSLGITQSLLVRYFKGSSNATIVSILVFPPFYFYHFWGVTCLPINLHMNTLLNT
ncbi:hypothetical protein HanPSC8_Chr16g0717251 [Helianthus annuus]|nr:hypothetical protein HanPSC8_Chr16g0717251 [Helianthus annuus]